MKLGYLAVLLFGITFAGASQATVINGTSLQDTLNGITQAGQGTDSSVNVQTDQVVNDKNWAISASGGSIATLIIELAGFANDNGFGIYDSSNPANYVEMMNGSATAGDQAVVSIKADGSVFLNLADTGINFAGNNFGYYLDSPDGRFYSDTALNGDGTDHMVAYQGTNTDTVQLPGQSAGLWTNNEYILAFEDLWNSHSDHDFNDFVAMVESVTPVPTPGSLALLGLGLALIGVASVRRRNV